MNEKEKDRWYELGMIARLEIISREIREKASWYFSRGEDKEAIILRDIADDYAKKHDEEEKKYQLKYKTTKE